jgi:type IV pilus assembly protein PilB
LTARDLISALRAVAHGADASEILGTEPRWEALFSTLLSILLRKGLIADWEFIEEFRKI